MRILFVLEAFWEWIGIRCLSASLKEAGYSCDLIIENDIWKVARYVQEHCPDLVGYLTISGQHKFCISSAIAIKEVAPQTKIIFGGPHATFFHDVINEDPVDYICQGEGDLALVELVRKMESNASTVDIPGIWAKQDGKVYRNPPQKLIEDLDSLPIPDNEIFEKYDVFRKSNSRSIMAGRGCPFECSFCFNKSFKELYKNKNKYVRFRSPERIIEEILYAKSKYPFKYIRFQDDTFLINKKWFLNFAEKYSQRVGLPYFASMRVGCVDKEIAKALKESNCFLVGFGLESGVEHIRNDILKKRISNEEIYQTTELLHKYKIPFATSNMLALPTETLKDGLQTIRLNQKIRTKLPWYSVFQPYPGTQIANLVESLYNCSSNPDKIGSDYHSGSILNTKDAKSLAKLHKFAILATKCRWTLPIVKLLIHFPDNYIFKIIHRISHAWVYSQINRNGFLNTVLIGVKYEIPRLKYALFYQKKDNVRQ